MPLPLLSFKNLSFERDDWPVFEGLSADIAAGDILQVTGPNGSGKTTLLNLLAGLLIPSSGALFWRGEEIHPKRFEYQADIIYLGHQPGLKLALTPVENLACLARLYPLGRMTALDALGRIGLTGCETLPCQSLSAGQVRRAALAQLCMSEASIWLLDEPLTALDSAGIDILEGLLVAHAQRGGAVVFSSHQPLPNYPVRTLSLDKIPSDIKAA